MRSAEAGITEKLHAKQMAKAIERVAMLRHATAEAAAAGEGEAVMPADAAEAAAQELLRAHKAVRDANVEMTEARQAEREREEEEEHKEARRTPKKDKRKLTKAKATPRHLGHANENASANAVEIE